MATKTYNCSVCRVDFDFPPNEEVCRMGYEFSDRVGRGEFDQKWDALNEASLELGDKIRASHAAHYEGLSGEEKKAYDESAKKLRRGGGFGDMFYVVAHQIHNNAERRNQ